MTLWLCDIKYCVITFNENIICILPEFVFVCSIGWCWYYPLKNVRNFEGSLTKWLFPWPRSDLWHRFHLSWVFGSESLGLKQSTVIQSGVTLQLSRHSPATSQWPPVDHRALGLTCNDDKCSGFKQIKKELEKPFTRQRTIASDWPSDVIVRSRTKTSLLTRSELHQKEVMATHGCVQILWTFKKFRISTQNKRINVKY